RGRGDLGGDHVVGGQRQVGPVLLDRAQREDGDGVGRQRRHLGPGEVGEPRTNRHRATPMFTRESTGGEAVSLPGLSRPFGSVRRAVSIASSTLRSTYHWCGECTPIPIASIRPI